jgi:hypothetical protein
MRRILPTLLCLFLAACGTQQEQCIAAQTRELITVNRLIRETQTNLARGYALETREVEETVVGNCERIVRRNGKTEVTTRPCFVDRTRTIRVPQAIDPAAEQRKLDGLVAKRRSLEQAAQPVIAACKARYPE